MRTINHRRHTSSGSYVRVWLDDWAPDVFRVLDRESFDTMREIVGSGAKFVDFDDLDEEDRA